MTVKEKIKGNGVLDKSESLRLWPMAIGICYSLFIGSLLSLFIIYLGEKTFLITSILVFLTSIWVLTTVVKHRKRRSILTSQDDFDEKEGSVPFISSPLALSGCIYIFIGISLAMRWFPGPSLAEFFGITFEFVFAWWIIISLLVGISLSLLSIYFECSVIQNKLSQTIGLLIIFLIPLHGIIFLERFHTGKNFPVLVYSVAAIVILCILSGYHSSKMLSEAGNRG